MITMVEEVGGGQKKEIYQLDRGKGQTDFDGMCLDGHRIPFSSWYLFCLVVVLELNLMMITMDLKVVAAL